MTAFSLRQGMALTESRSNVWLIDTGACGSLVFAWYPACCSSPPRG